jgi:CubicO group peptidase (beta-lactamase class C family)
MPAMGVSDGVLDFDRLRAVVAEQVDAGETPGAVLAVSCGGDVRIETVGAACVDGTGVLGADTVFRIASLTKPLVAAVTLMLVEDGVTALTAPIDEWLPELADRRVVRALDGPIGDTVAARRPITVQDLLTMRMGFGFSFDSACPVLDAAVEADLGIGPPDPSVALTPDEWITRFAALPLMHQPGADWMYEFSFGVLGVLLARISGRPLDVLLRERLLDPLGMTDTGFTVAASARDRLVPCYTPGAAGLEVFDGVTDSRWLARPAFPDARGGLVSTARDYLRFARLLLNNGVHEGTRLLSAASVTAMTTDQLGAQRATSASARIFLDSGGGWGYGVEVVTPELVPGTGSPRYGWGGGLGATWYSFPDRDTAAMLLTQRLPPPQQLVDGFFTTLRSMINA